MQVMILQSALCATAQAQLGQRARGGEASTSKQSVRNMTPSRQSQQPARSGTRRALLAGGSAALMSAAALLLPAGRAHANALEDFLKQKLRPELDPLDAVIRVLDARGVLLELEQIAASPPDSDLRFRTRALLPGYCRRLRDVAAAAPVVASLATGSSREAVVSVAYGGSGLAGTSPVDPVFLALGNILNFSGRGLRSEALAGPELAARGVEALDGLLAMLPRQTVEQAQQLRADARAASSLE